MPRQSRLEYDTRGIMGSAPSNTCCVSTVSTTMRADPHLRYRSDSNKKKKRMYLSLLRLLQDSSPDPFYDLTPSMTAVSKSAGHAFFCSGLLPDLRRSKNLIRCIEDDPKIER